MTSFDTPSPRAGRFTRLFRIAATGVFCVLAAFSHAQTYQAENATISSGVVATNHAGYTGTGFVDTTNATGVYVQFTVTSSAAASATVTIRYANGTTTNRPCSVQVNGATVNTALAFNSTTSFATWANQTQVVSLNAGSNTVRLTATTLNGCPNLDKIDVAIAATSPTLQAEAATIGGGTVIETTNGGYLGTGYVNLPTTGGFVQFANVNGGTGGSATIAVRFANGGTAARAGLLVINGVSQSISFPTTGAWTTWNTQNITAGLASGTANTIRFESNGTDFANIDQITVTPGSGTVTAPAITTQPASQTATVGSSATFSVVASGTGPLNYQWRFNGTAISGATASSLTRTNVQTANAGNYSVVVSNSAGTATSNNATLTVSSSATAPAITSQPASQTITAGGSATFSVSASGTGPLSYQWRFNGTAISGATSANYTVTNAQTANAGGYSAVVTNSVGTATSATATLTVNTQSTGGVIYVSPTGTASNPGTLAAPTTLPVAILEAQPGDTIFMRGGTYNFSATVVIAFGNNGTATNPKRLFAYQAEVPVLNFSAQATVDANRGVHLFGNYWHLKGLTIQNAGDNGMLVGGSNHRVELCIFKGNRDSGLQISRRDPSLSSMADWPSNNLILNCTAFDNADPGAENADGFACKLTSGTGNVFRGCIAHHNIDDGWDLFAKTETGPIGTVLIENCIAYANGTLTSGTTSGNGDKNGFKLGGSGIAVRHTLRRSLAFNNGKHGFTDNNNPGPITVTNNTAFNNVASNFQFREGGTHVFTNNASLSAGSSDKTIGTLTGTTNLFWRNNASSNDGGTKVISAADFQSLAVPAGGFARNADGSINLGNFAKLVAGSDLVNGGTPSGTDIGAVESF